MNEENKNLKSDTAFREEAILAFWKENRVFEKSLEKKSPKGHYVFYDGPPFATGQIHYGHILGSTAKDAIGRYQTMRGYYVPRKWGWDCHGLPIENIVEKELNIAGHKEIEAYGLDKFVEYARSKVLEYDADWRRGIERIGRWVDFEGGYKTMDNTFIESVWWALSEFNKKNLIYEGVRVLAYCPRCETPIAKSEIAMDNSYKDISDISVYVKFELKDEIKSPKIYLLVWTTTPWSLPGDVAVAVNGEAKYVKVSIEDAYYILAKDRISAVLKDKKFEIVEEFTGSQLVGKKYIPPFDYYTKNKEIAGNPKAWSILSAPFVTTLDGTGIAHEAPAFGEDDMELAKKENLPWIIHVDSSGRFKPEVIDFAGLSVKPKSTEKDGHQATDVEIIKYLAKKNLLFAKEKIIHSYPHCMRCDTPIIYYALPAWFINIQTNKKDILKNAESMNWIPGHLKEGRFKNIVESAPDWNISRNRYWASPLPIWKCKMCKNKTFISSLNELKKNTKKSDNKYFVMRHGEAENNTLGVVSTDPNNTHHLTEKGKKQVREVAKSFNSKKIDIIFTSPFLRTKETADLLSKEIDFSSQNIKTDSRLVEINEGIFSTIKEVTDFFSNNHLDRYDGASPEGECLIDVKKRVGEFIYEIDKKYKNKNILIITHEDTAWALFSVANGFNKKETEIDKKDKLLNAEIKELLFVPLPHNENYELDFHRPYIDKIKLACDCGEEMERIPEVLDCWFESGSMPFAQDHYPFENPNWKKNNFPAGFVAEYIGQTRTWFYYSHIVSSMLFDHAPYKNVVTTGTVRAEDGHKMSKSRHNYPDPWIFIDKYGVDALRLYLMSSPLMKGEDANFSEKSVQEIASKIIGRLFNVLAFYELYRDLKLEPSAYSLKPTNILDQWILSRLNQVLIEVTEGMEAYDMVLSTRPIESFVEDLSVWYLRRSRDRIKDNDEEAKQILYFVLKTLAKIIAPFAPFTAEDIWLRLRNENDVESVHLEKWPEVRTKFDIFKFLSKKSDVVKNMEEVRKIVSLGLEARQKAGIKVRQPLSELKVKSLKLQGEFLELIKDELNVKEVIEDSLIDTEVKIDTEITASLKAEGEYREFMRELQEMRKTLGLNPGDKMPLSIEKIYKKYKIMPSLQMHMLRVAAVATLICDSMSITIDRENIILACLLHDMGNIIKFRNGSLLEFYEPEGIEYWGNVKNEYVKKYGNNEHNATNKIMQELNLPSGAINLADQNRFSLICQHLQVDDINIQITHYADGRVGPYGVLSYTERMSDAQERYKGRSEVEEIERAKLVACGLEIEKQIFSHCKIRPEDITDEAVASIILELKDFVIK